jgi:hypothetical protein
MRPRTPSLRSLTPWLRSLTRSFAIAVAVAGLTSCAADAPTATEVTVQLAVVAGAEHGGRPFSTTMTQEVTAQPVWAGDPDGAGVALLTVNLGQREICWDLSVSAILLPATAAHIHKAAPGVRGGIVLALSPPDGTGTALGCASGLGYELLREILKNPDVFYVNVHTADFPAGAVRGQLAP